MSTRRCGASCAASTSDPGAARVGDLRPARAIGSTSPVTLDAPVIASSAGRARRAARRRAGGPSPSTVSRRLGTTRCAASLPGQQVGVVLDVEDHDVAGHGRRGQQVQRVGGVAGEDHRRRRRGAPTNSRDHVAGALVAGGADLRGVAGAAVHAGVVRQQVLRPGAVTCARAGALARVVEVGVRAGAAVGERDGQSGAGDLGERGVDPRGGGCAGSGSGGGGGGTGGRVRQSLKLPLVQGLACSEGDDRPDRTSRPT